MKIHTIFSLKWKSAIRHPLFEQSLIFRLLFSVYICSLLCLLFIAGFFYSQFCYQLFPEEPNPFLLFLFSFAPLLCVDFVLKFFLKKGSFQFLSLHRFPNSRNSINSYLLIRELFNFWNIYLLVFFYSYLTKNIYPDYGLLITFISFAVIYSSQLLISRLINYIKQNTIDAFSKPVFINHSFPTIASKSAITNYLSLSLKMIIRSPRLRQQFLVYLLLTTFYFYIMATKPENLDSFSIRLVLGSILFILFPLTFNQYLFSAEASFFDHLIITPSFKKILPTRYVLYLFFSFISLSVSLFIISFDLKGLVELIAIFLYCIGPITLFSFSSILFVSTKIDLFGSHYKMLTNPPSLQSLVVFLIYVFFMLLAIFVSWLFSVQAAIYFMLVTGGISILLSKYWFNYLYRCFYPGKYEKMEIFRMQ